MTASNTKCVFFILSSFSIAYLTLFSFAEVS